MKSLRLLLLAVIAALLTSFAFAQAPVITNITVKDTKCYYKVGTSTQPCSIGPGMTLIVTGSNFGKVGGGVSLCDCQSATTVKWTPTQVTVTVNAVNTSSGVTLETEDGGYTSAVPYTPLSPVITSITVGSCTYTPNQSALLCLITPGTQITINGSYFGPQTIYSAVQTCIGCGSATIDSWNPNWSTSPSPFNNQIVATANQTACGNSISLWTGVLGSNFIPYTAC
jgi:hypothetical protein